MLKISKYISGYTHHDYLEPELRKLIDSGTSDLLDLTFDADEVSLTNIESFLDPFIKSLKTKKTELVKYYEEDPFFQDMLGKLIIKHHSLKDVSKEQIFVGNGNYSLYKEIISFLLEKSLMIGNGPQYPEFPSYFTALGGKYKPVYNANTWEFPVTELIDQIKNNPKVGTVFMDIPSNSTGNYPTPEQLETIIQVAEKKGVIVLADEAYSNYHSPKNTAAQFVSQYSNVVVIRSLSKSYDMGGVRFGYAILSKELSTQFKKIHSPFEPSVFSCLCAKYFFENYKTLNATQSIKMKSLKLFRARTIALLKKYEITPLPGSTSMPQIMVYKKGVNLLQFFLDKKIVVRSGKMYKFTCKDIASDEFVRLRFPMKEKSFKEFEKRLSGIEK